MRSPTIQHCITVIFPFIADQLSKDEPIPRYAEETCGMNGLEKILYFMETEYYVSPEQKLSYLFCSTIESHHFSNGNKRLAVALLLYSLIINDIEILDEAPESLHQLMRDAFPTFQWKTNTIISHAHALFLYNLAQAIADKNVWISTDFGELQRSVAQIFQQIYSIPS